jgi:histidine ammonia-lyase
VDLTAHLLAQDVITSTNWIEVRKAQDPKRQFGVGPTAALAAVRKALPLGGKIGKPANEPDGATAYEFLKTVPVRSFYTSGPAQPAQPPVPVVGTR